jgi:predicted metalloprotease
MRRAQQVRRGVALAATVVMLTGCATAVAGVPLRADAPGTVAPGPTKPGPGGSTLPTLPADSGVPDSAVGLKPDAPAAGLTVEGDQHTEADTLAEDSRADVQGVYHSTFDKTFDTAFVPPGHYLSYDSQDPAASVCNHSLDGSVNASYVTPPCDTVIWDRGVLLPNMIKNIGVLSVPTTLAHEMGHRVQTILGFDDQANSVLVAEQQADCYAGAYWRWVNDGNSHYFNFNQTAGMRQVLSTMMTIRDPIGTNPSEADGTGQGAHGDAFDRIFAFTLGFANGAATCNGIDQAGVDARVSGAPFAHIPNPKTADNLPITDGTLADVTATVNDYFATAAPGYRPPTLVSSTAGAPPACDGAAAVSPVGYCPSSNAVSYDLSELQHIGTPTAGFSSFNGDFSAIILLVSRYALAAQAAGGASATGGTAGLRAVCFAGTWASWMRQPRGAKKLSLSPADLDKATYELINSPDAAGDASGTSTATIFDRVQAFNIGVTQSIDTCTRQYAG